MFLNIILFTIIRLVTCFNIKRIDNLNQTVVASSNQATIWDGIEDDIDIDIVHFRDSTNRKKRCVLDLFAQKYNLDIETTYEQQYPKQTVLVYYFDIDTSRWYEEDLVVEEEETEAKNKFGRRTTRELSKVHTNSDDDAEIEEVEKLVNKFEEVVLKSKDDDYDFDEVAQKLKFINRVKQLKAEHEHKLHAIKNSILKINNSTDRKIMLRKFSTYIAKIIAEKQETRKQVLQMESKKL